MTEFAYNNAKNASSSHIDFKLNCGFHLSISCKENVDLHSLSKLVNNLANELRELIHVYQENF